LSHRSASEGYRVLITAPFGRDAHSLAGLLQQDGYSTDVFAGLHDMAAAIDDSTGALLVTEEAFASGLDRLGQRLAAEQAWSDLPILLLASRHSSAGTDHGRLRRRLPPSITNVIILERPLGSVSLLTTVQVALRARQRQFEMRDSVAKLADSESRLRLSTAAADIGTWDYDPINDLLLWDDRCKAMFGLPPEAPVSYEDSFLAGIHPEDRQRAKTAVDSALSDKSGRYDIEYRTIGLADGVERCIAAKGGAVFRDDQAVRFIGTVIDISERKRAEQALAESAQALREESEALAVLTKVGQQVAAEFDLDRLVQHVVDAGVELTGAEFGAFFYNRIDDEGESYMLYALSGAPRSKFENFGMPRNTEVFAPTFAGEGPVRSGNIRKDPRYGHNEPHSGMPKGHLPVTSYLALPVISRTGDVLGGLFFGHADEDVFNERAERLALGLSAQAAVAIDNARLFNASQRVNQTLEARVADRTRELQAEMERRAETEAALRQSQKMEAVGQLTGGIAHDFNNMLTGVISGLDIVSRRLETGRLEGIDRFMDAAKSSAQRAASLTSRLLAFSRRQSLDSKPIDVNALAGSLTDLLERSITERIAFRFEPMADLPLAVVDENQLESAILNLAINARDAMPDGGDLVLRTSIEKVIGPSAYQTEMRPGHYVGIAVCDNGTGIDPELMDKVFEPFFTTKPIGQGTGLGLSMVYGFAQQSGGGVRIDSSPGDGTTVTLLLPVAETVHDAAEAESGTGPVLGDGQTVLLVEDDDSVRLLVSDLLLELGYVVLEAAEPETAIRTLETNAQIDLMVTDVGLPRMNGRQLAEIARQRRSELPILFLTGYAEVAQSRGEMLGPNMAMVSKPFALDDLSARIREMLASPVVVVPQAR
jgi:PAS domain S-box-containing protein